MSNPSLIPVKTRRMEPPKDNLFDVFAEALPDIQNGDVICVSAKVLAIHEGRCVPSESKTAREKDEFVKQQTPYWLPRELNRYGFMLTIIHNALIASAGIDNSNSGDYMTLLPEDPTASAKMVYDWAKEKYGVSELGVIVTDSHCIPLRWGTIGISIGAHGIKPLRDYRGGKDLFGYTMKVSQSNMIDPIAAAAVNLMGEGAEQTPIVIARNWPGIVFSEDNIWDDFVIAPEDDLFTPLLEIFWKDKT